MMGFRRKRRRRHSGQGREEKNRSAELFGEGGEKTTKEGCIVSKEIKDRERRRALRPHQYSVLTGALL